MASSQSQLPQISLSSNQASKLKPLRSENNLLQSAAHMSITTSNRYSKNIDFDLDGAGDTYSKQKRKNQQASCSVLPFSEIQRMRESIQSTKAMNKFDKSPEPDLNHAETGKTAAPKKLTQWEKNVLNNLKIKQEQNFKKFEEKEIELQQIDRDEEQYQENKKRVIVDRANKLIFNNEDTVKTFKRRMLLSDVMSDQQELIRINKMKNQRQKETENIFAENHQEMLQLQENREMSKLAKTKKLIEENKSFVLQQIQEAKNKYISRMQQDVIDGQVIKQHAEDLQQKELEKQLSHRKKLLENLEDLNSNMLLHKINEQQQEAEQMRINEEFQQKKEEIMNMRKIREQLKIKEIQVLRQKMIDEGIQRLKNQQDNENERIQKQIETYRKEEERKQHEKQEKIDQLKRSIDDSIKESLDQKKKLRQQEQEQQKIYSEKLQKRNASIEELDKMEKQFHQQRCLDLQNYQLSQMKVKDEKKRDEYFKSLEEDKKNLHVQELDRKIFKSWAESCIEEWKQNGKNVEPMLKELKKLTEQPNSPH